MKTENIVWGLEAVSIVSVIVGIFSFIWTGNWGVTLMMLFITAVAQLIGYVITNNKKLRVNAKGKGKRDKEAVKSPVTLK